MVSRLLIFTFIMLGAFALAQDSVTVNVMQSDTYGPYLTDGDGNSLYLFVNEDMMKDSKDPDTMTSGVRSDAAPCADKCLEYWPPLTAKTVTGGEGVDATLLYTADVGGMTMVVYNGWPLYYFANDEKAGDTNGQDSGKAPNIWYLVSPDGSINEKGE
jgi:predicted lipoprotein with Yx(FWY)xxD motif